MGWFLFLHPDPKSGPDPEVFWFGRTIVEWTIATTVEEAIGVTYFNGMPTGVVVGPISANNSNCCPLNYFKFLKEDYCSLNNYPPMYEMIPRQHRSIIIISKFMSDWWQEFTRNT